ncbi:MAG: hypothetical protein Q7R93_04415 [bacterium]|nr:hypothetical protein [bacterium]
MKKIKLGMSRLPLEWRLKLIRKVFIDLIKGNPKKMAYAFRVHLRRLAIFLILMGEKSSRLLSVGMTEHERRVMHKQIAGLSPIPLDEQCEVLQDCTAVALKAVGSECERPTIPLIQQMIEGHTREMTVVVKVYFRRQAALLKLLDPSSVRRLQKELSGDEKQILADNPMEQALTLREKVSLLDDFTDVALFMNSALAGNKEIADLFR